MNKYCRSADRHGGLLAGCVGYEDRTDHGQHRIATTATAPPIATTATAMACPTAGTPTATAMAFATPRTSRPDDARRY